MIRTLENRFYYLDNFHTVLDWIAQRYTDLLDEDERAFIRDFPTLPAASRALLVRMVMRKGELFRAAKLMYEEIGCPREAARPLLEAGWVDDGPLLDLDQLFALLTKSELAAVFSDALPSPLRAARKAEQLEALRPQFAGEHRFEQWCPAMRDGVYRLRVAELCDRLRLMFFGNLRQDWSEFVLSDLGITAYEKVDFPASARAFRSRQDIDCYLHLYRCREWLEHGVPLAEVLAAVPPPIDGNPWLEDRRAKLLYQVAQAHEKLGELDRALAIYLDCAWDGARARAIRMMERLGQTTSAFELANLAQQSPESESERQQLRRMLPRLTRKLGHPKPAGAAATAYLSPARIDLSLPRPALPQPVEEAARHHLHRMEGIDGPVHYVENTLINSLFGLLCWEAVFTPVQGAFFHPFHDGPVDLLRADFGRRRSTEFAACLSQLESGQYKQTIRRNFMDKAGIQSPFVYWGILSEELLELALACIPAAHLGKWFERILADLRANRAGFPDLIQFWPNERRYRMIEVKGPGDRLQDNQIRWLDFFTAHRMPVAVCYVRWQEDAA